MQKKSLTKKEDRFEKLLKEIQLQRQESEKRFEQTQTEWNKRFEQTQTEWNKRFEQTQTEWNRKWEENQKRFEQTQTEWNKRFEQTQAEWNKRFEQNQTEWNRKWEENQKRFEQTQTEWNKRFEQTQTEWNKRFEQTQTEWNKRFEQTQTEWNKKWEENQKVINSILEEIKFLHRKHDTTIGALGARWGFRAEASFRDAIKAILEESFPVKVQRYSGWDEEGLVFGKPDQVELDIIVKDEELIVAEIKSSISKGDVVTFLRKISVYEKKEGVSVKRKLLISPMIDSGAKSFAISSQIEVYGYPEEVDFKELQSAN